MIENDYRNCPYYKKGRIDEEEGTHMIEQREETSEEYTAYLVGYVQSRMIIEKQNPLIQDNQHSWPNIAKEYYKQVKESFVYDLM